MSNKKRIGIIGGLGALAGADVFFKLVKLSSQNLNGSLSDFVFEQRAFDVQQKAGSEKTNQVARKLYIYDMIKDFSQRKVDFVVLPCFVSHTFLNELKSEVKLPIIDMMEGLQAYVKSHYPKAKKIGVLTSDFVKNKKLFESYFLADNLEIIYPEKEEQAELMDAIYSLNGLQSGCLQGVSVAKIQNACSYLLSKQVDLILPGFTEIPLIADMLPTYNVPVLDTNKIYATYALGFNQTALRSVFKIGVVGGVGPAATTDFMNKIIKNTPAKRDQEHIKLMVEHNPQIPDRTESLLSNGADPTVALYATCKKLEANDSSIIAIPCNTAHAFVERIQPYLGIPIVNMLFETIEYIKKFHEGLKKVGLLATSGTIKSCVYHDIILKAGLSVITPDDMHQGLVMQSIYGEYGVKAGKTDGVCKVELLTALEHLVNRGAEIVLLGCTELPLLISQNESMLVGQKNVVVLDPTEILARKCVELSEECKV